MALYSVIAGLNKELADLKQIQGMLQAEIDTVKHVNESLSRRVMKKDQVCESLKADKVILENKLEDLSKENERLGTMWAETDTELTATIGEASSIQTKNMLLQEDIKSLKAEVVHYKLESCNLQNEVDHLKVLRKIVDRVRE
jgi:chromosome segregation ATPase